MRRYVLEAQNIHLHITFLFFIIWYSKYTFVTSFQHFRWSLWPCPLLKETMISCSLVKILAVIFLNETSCWKYSFQPYITSSHLISNQNSYANWEPNFCASRRDIWPLPYNMTVIIHPVTFKIVPRMTFSVEKNDKYYENGPPPHLNNCKENNITLCRC